MRDKLNFYIQDVVMKQQQRMKDSSQLVHEMTKLHLLTSATSSHPWLVSPNPWHRTIVAVWSASFRGDTVIVPSASRLVVNVILWGERERRGIRRNNEEEAPTKFNWNYNFIPKFVQRLKICISLCPSLVSTLVSILAATHHHFFFSLLFIFHLLINHTAQED